jgi:hypothetical protein
MELRLSGYKVVSACGGLKLKISMLSLILLDIYPPQVGLSSLSASGGYQFSARFPIFYSHRIAAKAAVARMCEGRSPDKIGTKPKIKLPKL